MSGKKYSGASFMACCVVGGKEEEEMS